MLLAISSDCQSQLTEASTASVSDIVQEVGVDLDIVGLGGESLLGLDLKRVVREEERSCFLSDIMIQATEKLESLKASTAVRRTNGTNTKLLGGFIVGDHHRFATMQCLSVDIVSQLCGKRSETGDAGVDSG